MNKTLLCYLKKRLTPAQVKWVDELPIIPWAYRTTPKQLTRETLYALAYGVDALIPIEFELETLRTSDTSELSQALDELQENRDQAVIRTVEYHRQAYRQREKIIKPKSFTKGDLVLRSTFKEGKLKPNWEGPFIIVDDRSKGAYRIQSQCEKIRLTLGTRLI